MSSAYENAMSDLQANNATQQYPVTQSWQERDEAAEARTAQAEAERDNQFEINVTLLQENIGLRAERDELRSQLEQAQNEISALGNYIDTLRRDYVEAIES